MKKLLLISAVLLNAISVAKADTVLVIPPHQYSDGKDYPEYIRLFLDSRYKNSWTECQDYSRWLHKSRISAPMYSMCSPVETLADIRGWR